MKRAKIADLNLYMNDLGDAGLKKVSLFLPMTLCQGCNSANSSEGGFWAQIAEALSGDDNLVSLDVNGNNVGPAGITALAESLKTNQNLRTLEVSYNPIGPSGGKAIVDILKFDLQVTLWLPFDVHIHSVLHGNRNAASRGSGMELDMRLGS